MHTAGPSLKGTSGISFSYFYFLIKIPHVGIEKKLGEGGEGGMEDGSRSPTILFYRNSIMREQREWRGGEKEVNYVPLPRDEERSKLSQ